MTHFELQPDPTQLQQLAEDYFKDNPGELDIEARAFDAGKRIREGEYSITNLEAIVRWKSARVIHYIGENSAHQIAEALAKAAAPKTTVSEALEALIELRGVALPVASAILTAIFPERYTVIDFRALDALGHRPQDLKFYEEYLAFCQTVAEEGLIQPQPDYPGPTSLRALDRALWQWSSSRAKNVAE